MRRTAAVITAAVVALALTGCGGPDYGEIHDKRHTDAYYSTICTGSKPVICTPVFHPATWYLDLYATTDDHGWKSVSEEVYESYEVGDYYDGRTD